jgi:Uma2 family endonuclease
MSTISLERTPMSLAEFHALPEGVRAEYVDGVAIVTPQQFMSHNLVAGELAVLLDRSLSGVKVVYNVGLRLGPERFRIPDLVAVDRIEETHWTEQVPHLVVEVLSEATRSEDLYRKTTDYRHAGVGQYWIVDRDRRWLVALANNGDGWDIALELSSESPTGSVVVGELGSVELDLAALLDF